ncbi:Hypothetical_protein [Hexamita inflata]|uniref:Hypothetical_protein n=1 Tax=Hexamita inflata TaxID=28002 RepID=A0ABP1JXG3_9EUKA
MFFIFLNSKPAGGTAELSDGKSYYVGIYLYDNFDPDLRRECVSETMLFCLKGQKSDDQFNFSNLNQFQKYLVQREEKTFTMQQIDKYTPRIQNEMLKIVADPLLSLQFISKMSILKLELRLCPKIHMDLESETLKELTMYNCPMDNMNWVQNVKHLQLLDLNYIDKLDLNKIDLDRTKNVPWSEKGLF